MVIVMLFNTKNNTYMYDNDIGMILPYSPILTSITSIEKWNEKKENDIINLLEEKYDVNDIAFYFKWLNKREIFLNSIINNFNKSKLTENNIKYFLLSNGYRQLILSITEECNFRCNYCVYDDDYVFNRNHSSNYMTFKTAKKAVDMYISLFNQCKQYDISRELSISFYGGEPLLNFKLIQQIVDYIDRNSNKFKVNYSITTNGSLLSSEISDWLIEHDFLICISLDGDSYEHNRKRKFKNNKNSFHIVMNNIKYLINKNYSKIYAVSVFDWQTNLVKCDTFFKYNKIPILSISQVDDLFTQKYYQIFSKNDYDKFIDHLSNIKDNYVISSSESYLYHLVEEPIVKLLFESMMLTSKHPFINYTGTCVPGEKIYVTTNGEYHICERVTEEYNIGNVNDGLSYDKIIDIIQKYNSKLDACPSCLLSNTCQKCYKHFMYNNTFKTSKELCSNYMYEMNFFLNDVLTIMEKNQNTIEKNNIKFKNLYNWRL